MISAQRAARAHRQRIRAHGLVHIEVQAPAGDSALIRSIAEVLCNDPAQAQDLQRAIAALLAAGTPVNASEIFRSDLPDDAFEGVFDQPPFKRWRKVEL
jgi:hypothetical protein